MGKFLLFVTEHEFLNGYVCGVLSVFVVWFVWARTRQWMDRRARRRRAVWAEVDSGALRNPTTARGAANVGRPPTSPKLLALEVRAHNVGLSPSSDPDDRPPPPNKAA